MRRPPGRVLFVRRYTPESPGAIAQLGERLAGSQKVTGSSPVGSIPRLYDGGEMFIIARGWVVPREDVS